MSSMDDLVTWLRAQLDEDERVAHRASPGYEPDDPLTSDEDRRHVARWDRARVLAEVEAKRRILNMWIEWHGPPRDDPYHAGRRDQLTEDVRALAQPYAGRDGWREEWRA